jgi:hypothetical protein
MNLTITGIEEIFAKFGKVLDAEIVNNALHDTADKLLEISDVKVPVGEGQLKSSKTVQSNIADKSIIAGYNEEYAGYQHQGRRMNGTRIVRQRPAGGQSFFLSTALNENRSQLIELAGERITKQLQNIL